MNNINLTIPQDVLDFLDVVVEKTKGYNVYLGGGYLRDIYFNSKRTCPSIEDLVSNGMGNAERKLTPKDLDIFFTPSIFFNVEDTIRELPVIAKTYINYDTLAKDIPDMQERGVDSVRGMFVKGLSTCDVQFIKYSKYIFGPEHLAKDMDMNINQIMYCPVNKTFHVTEDFINGHKDKIIKCLHEFDKYRMYKRYKRMMAKFPSYSIITDLDMEYYHRLDEKKPKRSGASSISFVD